MLINFVIITFIIAFIAVVVFGHVLLVTAIWPRKSEGLRQHSVDTRASKVGALQPE